MNSVNIGERLTQLRAMMAAESLVPDAWPRTLVARKAGVSLAAYTRLESTGPEDVSNSNKCGACQRLLSTAASAPPDTPVAAPL